ncbi:hypothetical protein Tco_1019108 [Tanacetum coccineum]|uniref:Uncharacterized protein n=1 Tax=Tanacetum coccineum TaxID=301880 RepID=A0ABQ5FXM3_9ASTR
MGWVAEPRGDDVDEDGVSGVMILMVAVVVGGDCSGAWRCVGWRWWPIRAAVAEVCPDGRRRRQKWRRGRMKCVGG